MKKFKTVNGSNCRIALTSGHVFNVTSEWEELADIAHSEAYAKGCISEDMITGESKVGLTTEVLSNIRDTELEKHAIREVIQKAMDESDEAFFKKSGDPNLIMVNKAMGRVVDRGLVNDVWGMMLANQEIDIDIED